VRTRGQYTTQELALGQPSAERSSTKAHIQEDVDRSEALTWEDNKMRSCRFI
jgi:hypothetical protein